MKMILEGDLMSVSDIIKSAIENSDKQKKEIAAHMGWTPQNFANRLKKQTIDANEWVKIAKFLGYEVKMVESKGKKKRLAKRKGIGKRVVMMVNKVTYDTDKASAICHTSKFAGHFMELYKDPSGVYLIVLYADWLEDGIIMTVDEAQAMKFMEECMYKAGL